MTKLFKNDLFLPHDSVVKAGSGAQFCVDIHGFEGGGVSSHFNYIPGYKIVHTSCTCTIMKKNYWGGVKAPHNLPLGPLLFSGSGQYRFKKILVGF